MIYIIIWIIVLLILSIIYFYYEDFKVKQTRYELKTDKINNDYKIIQISDFHNEKNKWLHKQLINIIENEKPYIIVITGDLIDAKDNKYAKKLIEEIKLYAPIYYAPGNHEYEFGGYEKLRKILADNNINLLENASIKIDNNINIFGIKDPMFESPRNEIEVVKEKLDNFKIDNKNYNILLSHRPEKFDIYYKYDFDLVFTGHAHGGQFILPFIGPVFSPHQGLFPKLARGIHKKNNTTMVVSRGLGNSLYAIIRINNRPELNIVSLLKK